MYNLFCTKCGYEFLHSRDWDKASGARIGSFVSGQVLGTSLNLSEYWNHTIPDSENGISYMICCGDVLVVLNQFDQSIYAFTYKNLKDGRVDHLLEQWDLPAATLSHASKPVACGHRIFFLVSSGSGDNIYSLDMLTLGPPVFFTAVGTEIMHEYSPVSLPSQESNPRSFILFWQTRGNPVTIDTQTRKPVQINGQAGKLKDSETDWNAVTAGTGIIQLSKQGNLRIWELSSRELIVRNNKLQVSYSGQPSFLETRNEICVVIPCRDENEKWLFYHAELTGAITHLKLMSSPLNTCELHPSDLQEFFRVQGQDTPIGLLYCFGAKLIVFNRSGEKWKHEIYKISEYYPANNSLAMCVNKWLLYCDNKLNLCQKNLLRVFYPEIIRLPMNPLQNSTPKIPGSILWHDNHVFVRLKGRIVCLRVTT